MNIAGTPADISSRHPRSKIAVADTISSWVISTQTPTMWEKIVDDGMEYKKRKEKKWVKKNQELFMFSVYEK